MATKLTDSELANRTRESNRRRGERHRERLQSAGKSALTVWIPDTLRTALTTKAAKDGATLADTAAALLSLALALDTKPHPVDTVTRFILTPEERAERDRAILELHSQRLSGHEIGRRLGCSEKTVRLALKRVQKVTT